MRCGNQTQQLDAFFHEPYFEDFAGNLQSGDSPLPCLPGIYGNDAKKSWVIVVNSGE